MNTSKRNRFALIGLLLVFTASLISGGCAMTAKSEDTMALVERAEQAAARAEEAALRAEKAADRADMMAEKSERIFNQKMKK